MSLRIRSSRRRWVTWGPTVPEADRIHRPPRSDPRERVAPDLARVAHENVIMVGQRAQGRRASLASGPRVSGRLGHGLAAHGLSGLGTGRLTHGRAGRSTGQRVTWFEPADVV